MDKVSKDFFKSVEEILEKVYLLFQSFGREGIDLDLEAHQLTVTMPKGEVFLLTAHGTQRQLWVSSPLSGGLHFVYRLPLVEEDTTTRTNSQEDTLVLRVHGAGMWIDTRFGHELIELLSQEANTLLL